MTKGALFIISAPSGAGKTTLIKRAGEDLENIAFSVSHTTRAPRPGETDGISYHFTDRDAFIEMIDNGEFAEWANVHGNLYGTSLAAIESAREGGNDVILDIDVQGALQLLGGNVEGVKSIFILPPSWAELEKRLRKRGDTAEETISRRMANARGEVDMAAKYDYIVINDDIERALSGLRSIIKTHRLEQKRILEANPVLVPEN